jgi:hypothetical protein
MRPVPLLSVTTILMTLALAHVCSCEFALGELPPIQEAPDGGGTGGASSASASSSASSSAASSGGGPATTSAGSSGGGTSSSAAASSASSSSSSSTGGCTTDLDGDGFISWKCGGDDCADEDARAHPGAGFQATPVKGERRNPTLDFDFDCNDAVTAETQVCTLGCNTQKPGFKQPVACGDMAPLGSCAVACLWVAKNPAETPVQRCK